VEVAIRRDKLQGDCSTKTEFASELVMSHVPFDFPAFRETYQRDGVVWPIRLFEPEGANALAGQYKVFQKRAKETRGREIYIKPHLVSTWVDAIAHNPFLLDIVEAAIGPDILLWSSDFFVKTARTGKYVCWHQDTPYWELTPVDNIVNIWLALTPSTLESGCMQAVKGTHVMRDIVRGRTGFASRDEQANKTSDNLLAYEQELSLNIRDEDVANLVLSPGEFSVHHGHLVHGGRPNQADFDRVGLVLRYISTDTRQSRDGDAAMLMRGRDIHGHYDLEPRPTADFDATSLAVLADSLNRPSGFFDTVVA
jgi:ectoine hydroxylase-related dioxygenase (phytanoyl-CoA dioxygenase family)